MVTMMTVCQGYGLMVLEQYKVRPDGTLLTRGPGNYKIPSVGNIPQQFNVTLLRDSGNPKAVYSSKVCVCGVVVVVVEGEVEGGEESHMCVCLWVGECVCVCAVVCENNVVFFVCMCICVCTCVHV